MSISTGSGAATSTWNFRVYLDDKPIGYHRFTLHENADDLELVSEARFDVKVLGISVYRYTHNALERWKGGCLSSLESQTDDNGQVVAVAARREGARLKVRADADESMLAGCVMTFAYWNPRMLDESHLLNAQTGGFERVKVERMGDERVATSGGEEVLATRYHITGSKYPIDLWYSAQREWLALESVVAGGRRLRYRLG